MNSEASASELLEDIENSKKIYLLKMHKPFHQKVTIGARVNTIPFYCQSYDFRYSYRGLQYSCYGLGTVAMDSVQLLWTWYSCYGLQ